MKNKNQKAGFEKKVYKYPDSLFIVTQIQRHMLFSVNEAILKIEDKKGISYLHFLAALTFFVFAYPQNSFNHITLIELVWFIIGYICGLYFLIDGLFAPRSIFIFDRLEQTITHLDGRWLQKKIVTRPLKDVTFDTQPRLQGKMIDGFFLAVVKTNGWTWSPFAMFDIDKDSEAIWSFFLWYIDKNRPLPPGEIFDPYRQKDFERRKSEGFPPPLYPSNIPTPEATTEQQKEREKYWKG